MARAEILLENVRKDTNNLEKESIRKWVFDKINGQLAK